MVHMTMMVMIEKNKEEMKKEQEDIRKHQIKVGRINKERKQYIFSGIQGGQIQCK